MIKSDTLSKILWSTIEDYVGTWEIIWELNSIFANYNEVENKKTAKSILKYFYNNGLIECYISTWGKSKDFEKIDINNFVTLMNKDKFWSPPSVGEKYFAFASTKKGEDFYKNEKLTDLG